MAAKFDETSYPGVMVKGIAEVTKEFLANRDRDSFKEERVEEAFQSSLVSRVLTAYETNKMARDKAGIDDEMELSVFQANGEYTTTEKAAISEAGQPEIFMNVTATKSRAARSWIKDLTQPPDGWPFSIASSPIETVPDDILGMIQEAFEEDEKIIISEIEKEQAKDQGQAPAPTGAPQVPGQQPQPSQKPPMTASRASKKLREISKLRREIDEALRHEITLHSNSEVKKIERKIQDSLAQGDWNRAFSEFVADFTIFPTAFLKGPVVTTGKTLVWKDGVPRTKKAILYKTVRVSPFDMYPSPSASTIQEGDFCEHLRLTRKQLADFGCLDERNGFYPKTIQSILINSPNGTPLSGVVDTGLEERRALLEKRGNQTDSNKGIYHGIHFWGTSSVKELKEFGYPSLDLIDDDGVFLENWMEVEIEAIVIGSEVIKCIVNKDPLGRRPYYSAAFHPRPGSVWGKSLPFLMRDIQRVCNAAARALVDNMAFSAGPQCSVLVDRLADQSDIEDQHPKKLWQFESDPQGNGGKPIEWFIVPSAATELINVYNQFEAKADDVTGVPRYAYGNENVGGAGQTAQGLSMLLESASKGIKSAIKNISESVLIPRVEYQFYLELLQLKESDTPSSFTGDINVIVHAIEAINIRAAEMESRQNLLKLLLEAPVVADMLGYEGLGVVLNSVFKVANLPEDAIPTALDLRDRQRKKEQEAKDQQAAVAQVQKERGSVSLEATKLQTDAMDRANQRTAQQKQQELEQRKVEKSQEFAIKQAGVVVQASKVDKSLQASQERTRSQEANVNKQLAVTVQKQQRDSQIPDGQSRG